MSVILRALGVSIPEKRLSNDDLATIVDTTDEWIRGHTGIGARHIAEDGKMPSDLGADAALKALKAAKIEPRDLDIIVTSTATPDYYGFPSTACVIQDKIGAHGCAAMDLAAGCTGFVYGMQVANGFLEAGQGKHALVIGTEILSRAVDWTDRSTCVLFGDGAGAAVLSRIQEPGRGILKCILGADGGGARDLYFSGHRYTKAFEQRTVEPAYIVMDGKNVYNFAVKSITVLIERIIHASIYSMDEIKWIVPHQANVRIVQAAAKRLGLPESKFFMNIEEYANTSAASIPIALEEMCTKGLVEKGDLILLIGFGAGLTYGAMVIRW